MREDDVDHDVIDLIPEHDGLLRALLLLRPLVFVRVRTTDLEACVAHATADEQVRRVIRRALIEHVDGGGAQFDFVLMNRNQFDARLKRVRPVEVRHVEQWTHVDEPQVVPTEARVDIDSQRFLISGGGIRLDADQQQKPKLKSHRLTSKTSVLIS